jgi:hypothetical protein
MPFVLTYVVNSSNPVMGIGCMLVLAAFSTLYLRETKINKSILDIEEFSGSGMVTV